MSPLGTTARVSTVCWMIPLALTLACGGGGAEVEGDTEASSSGETGGPSSNTYTTAPTTQPGNDTNDCPIGAEGCPCTSGGSCDAGLVCLSQLCVDPGTEDTTDSGSTTGSDASTGESTATTGGETTRTTGTTGTTGTTNDTTGTTDDTTGTTGDTTGTRGDTTDTTGNPLCPDGVVSTLAIEEDGWIWAECNEFGIQGGWYCYTDGQTESTCLENVPPYDDGKMCLSGETLGPIPNTWGAGIGLGLAETDDDPPVKMPYDAASRGIVGFSVTITGSTGGNDLRVGFTTSAMPTLTPPFVVVPGAGTHDLLFEDAIVPPDWAVPNAGETVDPTAIYDIQFQVAGDGVAAPFDFCVTDITPIQ